MSRREGRENARPLRTVRRFVAFGLAWSLLWWLLSQGSLESWLVGGPTVLAATGLSTWLDIRSTWHWQFRGMAGFAVHFGRASLLGGVDVAWRAVHPRLPIDPRMMQYTTRLPSGTSRVFFANIISLCPGTVSASLRDGVLKIHVIDARQANHARLAALEQAVGSLFGVDLSPDESRVEPAS